MRKKGFTLVELSAVIAILAILVIIALPNVMGMFNQAKKNSFTTEVKNVFQVAQQQWMTDSMMSTDSITYARVANGASLKCNGKDLPQLQLSGRTELQYIITINKSGNVTKFYAKDGTYQMKSDVSGLKIENIGKDGSGAVIEELAKTGVTEVTIACP